MKHVDFITATDAEFGFRLAGISQQIAEIAESESELKKAIGAADAGLVVIDERLIKELDDEKMRNVQAGWPGILLVLPAPTPAASEEEDYAVRLIRRAIGYHVRVKA